MRLLTLLLFFVFSGYSFGQSRPNILYIYVDDMGWGSIGPNAQFERKAESKAQQGVRKLPDQGAVRGIAVCLRSVESSALATGGLALSEFKR